jgi:hypothetical protein
MGGARHSQVVTHAGRLSVRPATRCPRVVSTASARGMAGRIVVSRRANILVPTHPVWVISPRPWGYSRNQGVRGTREWQP